MTSPRHHTRNLSPEEDAVAEIAAEAEDIDDSLPADLWFRVRRSRTAPRTDHIRQDEPTP